MEGNRQALNIGNEKAPTIFHEPEKDAVDQFKRSASEEGEFRLAGASLVAAEAGHRAVAMDTEEVGKQCTVDGAISGNLLQGLIAILDEMRCQSEDDVPIGEEGNHPDVQAIVCKANDKMVEKVLIKLDAKKGDKLWDVTHGQGSKSVCSRSRLILPLPNNFRRCIQDFLSEYIKEFLDVARSDFFKNCRVENNNGQYVGVLPIEEAINAVIAYGGAKFILFDPPYASTQGGHTILNNNLEKSGWAIWKNFVYGVDYKYSENQILFFYVNFFVVANKTLADGGYLLVKAMDAPNFPLTHLVEQCAGLFGYARVGMPQEFPSMSNGSKKVSLLTIFQRCPTKSRYKKGILYSLDDASAVTDRLVASIGEKAKADYLSFMKSSLEERQVFMQGLELICAHQNCTRDAILGRIREGFPGLVESFELPGNVDCGTLSDSADVETIQRCAVKLQTAIIATKNVFGVCFALLLKPSSTVEEKIAVMKRLGFSEKLVKKLTRARTGLECISTNMTKMQDGLVEKKKKSEDNSEDEKGGKKQRTLARWLEPNEQE